MNELNYCSLGAAQKLISNGIVLETDYYWATYSESTLQSIRDAGKVYPRPYLVTKESIHEKHRTGHGYYPAPCFTDVWRELPEEYDTETRHLELQVDKIKRVDGVIVTSANYIYDDTENGCCVYKFFAKENPTDALIDLLIWVREQNKDRIVNKLLDRADKLKW